MAATQPDFNPTQHHRLQPELDAESRNALDSIRLEEEFLAADELARCQRVEETCFALAVFVYRTYFRGLRMILFGAYRVEVVEALQRWLLAESVAWSLEIAESRKMPLEPTGAANLQKAITASVRQCENWWRYRRALKELADAWDLQHLIDRMHSRQGAGSSDAGNLSRRLLSGWNYLEEAFGGGGYDGPELFVLADCGHDLRAVTQALELGKATTAVEAREDIRDELEVLGGIAEYELSAKFRDEVERLFPLLLKSDEEITKGRMADELYAQRAAFVAWCCSGNKRALGTAAGFQGVRPDANVNKWLKLEEKRHNGSPADRKMLQGGEKLWHQRAGRL